MSNEHNDNHEHDEHADDLDQPTPAVFAAPDDWWRTIAEGLDDERRRKLLAGELNFSGFADDGATQVPLEVPEHLRAELGG